MVNIFMLTKNTREERGLTFDDIIGKTDFQIWPFDLARQFKKKTRKQ